MPENFLPEAKTFFNIGDYVKNLGQTGVLQTNKFVVQMNAPGLALSTSSTTPSLLSTILQATPLSGSSGIGRLIAMRAESVHIPGATLTAEQNFRYGVGPRQSFPTNINFTESTITFLDDGNNNIWKFIYAWMNLIIAYSNKDQPTYTLNYKDEYAQTITIYVLDNAGQNITTIDLLEAFPVSLNDINLSWADNNNLLRVTATFSFTRWNERSISIDNSVNPLNLIKF